METSMTEFTEALENEIPRLRRYAWTLTRDPSRADDLVQNCLVRALGNEHRWQPGTNLRAWVFTILHNQHISDLRRAGREQSRGEAIASFAAQSDSGSVFDLIDLDRALARLPEPQRRAILLVGLEDMSYDEAAAVLGLPVGTLRSRLGRARERLRSMFDDRQTRAAPAHEHRRRPRSRPAAVTRGDQGRLPRPARSVSMELAS
jgi:RNA polymerase sigma-70 factor, ECF subfamily